jgi:hypothetical protein
MVGLEVSGKPCCQRKRMRVELPRQGSAILTSLRALFISSRKVSAEYQVSLRVNLSAIGPLIYGQPAL